MLPTAVEILRSAFFVSQICHNFKKKTKKFMLILFLLLRTSQDSFMSFVGHVVMSPLKTCFHSFVQVLYLPSEARVPFSFQVLEPFRLSISVVCSTPLPNQLTNRHLMSRKNVNHSTHNLFTRIVCRGVYSVNLFFLVFYRS